MSRKALLAKPKPSRWRWLAIVGLPLLTMGLLSCMTRKIPELGLKDGRLKPCPNKMNCVSSDEDRPSYLIPPLAFKGYPDEAWEKLMQAVDQMNGNVVVEQDGYLWVTFTTDVFRFVDDMEFRMDSEKKMIHVRSGSRIGYMDFGVNKRRVERLRNVFDQLK